MHESTTKRPGLLSDEARAERYLLAKTLADFPEGVGAIIDSRFRHDEFRTKAAAPALSSIDVALTSGPNVEFMRHLTRNSVTSAVYLRAMQVAFNTPFADPFSATASYVPRGHAIPAFSNTLQDYSLSPANIGAAAAMTKTALEQQGAEVALGAAMHEACLARIDAQLLDPDTQLTGSPIPITVDAPSVSATGDSVASMRALLRNLSSWTSPLLVMHPELGVQLNLSTGSPFLDVGATGGYISAIPVVTSESVPLDSTGSTIVLIDCTRIVMALGGVEISRSTDANLLLQDTIDSNGTAESIGLFQADAIAVKALMTANWRKIDGNAVRVMTGCDW